MNEKVGTSSPLALKSQIQDKLLKTKRGLSTSLKEVEEIENLVQRLESKCPFDEPARNPLMGGRWIVDYTTAPPPSNGKLGPFIGVARQIIDLEAGTYSNYLSVPGEIKKEWLSATLDATFEEWDGKLLKDIKIQDVKEDALIGDVTDKLDTRKGLQSIFNLLPWGEDKDKTTLTDFGRDCWKVDFKTLSIKILGFQIFSVKFNEGTSRVWKMSYLDQETRIVRAGRTGKDEDAWLFYMSRDVDV